MLTQQTSRFASFIEKIDGARTSFARSLTTLFTLSVESIKLSAIQMLSQGDLWSETPFPITSHDPEAAMFETTVKARSQ